MDLASLLGAALENGAQALLLTPGGPLLASLGPQIVQFAVQHRLPTMGTVAGHARAGGLMGYGPDGDAIRRRSAVYVDKILKGARPGDLPVEQPMTFRLVVNLRTAEAIAVTIAIRCCCRPPRSSSRRGYPWRTFRAWS